MIIILKKTSLIPQTMVCLSNSIHPIKEQLPQKQQIIPIKEIKHILQDMDNRPLHVKTMTLIQNR